jgi:hypothetical protein
VKVRDIIKIIVACVALIFAAFLIIGFFIMSEEAPGAYNDIMYTAIVLAIFSFWLIFSAVKPKKNAPGKVKCADLSYMTEKELQEIQNGTLPEISDVPVVLGVGEMAHYFAPACRYITKTKAVGRTGGHGGINFRVAKGVSIRTGKTAGQTIYGDVTDKFNGQIVLTNLRLIFIAERSGFEVKLSSISAIVPGVLIMIQSGSKSYTMEIAQAEYFNRAIRIALSAAINNKNSIKI